MCTEEVLHIICSLRLCKNERLMTHSEAQGVAAMIALLSIEHLPAVHCLNRSDSGVRSYTTVWKRLNVWKADTPMQCVRMYLATLR